MDLSNNPQSKPFAEENPFVYQHSKSFAQILFALKSSLVLSTYQTGKVVMFSPKSEEKLIQLPRNFRKPMGVASHGKHLAVACIDEIILTHRSQNAAKTYPNKPDTYDAIYLPRSTHYTGVVDTHDICYGKEGLWAVITQFSCIAQLDSRFSFLPRWKPKFISEIMPGDRCHLNGMTLKDGVPKYVTALGKSDKPGGWRDHKLDGGILMDVDTNETLIDGLAMPHSPRLIGDEIYYLQSALGELWKYHIPTKTNKRICEVPGFARGMSFYQNFLFIGLSKIREDSKDFGKMPVASKNPIAGVAIVNLMTKQVEGLLEYKDAVKELYDVHILPGIMRPNILNNINPTHSRAIITPKKIFWTQNPEESKKSDK
ncbi:TIGR03032 family protein [Ekhidna lutea]|uniref:TIGR03032 family protein n=1 Tax=Ekhidna lutea TaxID=447679 RepID=A0A239HKB5_EKHLU|nr:TIGR03032 family protein [Ekhidna lutea]SNS80704.1 TIGR03032 family protein [Ekhidna lutea]